MRFLLGTSCTASLNYAPNCILNPLVIGRGREHAFTSLVDELEIEQATSTPSFSV
jgi:hypothetical protein